MDGIGLIRVVFNLRLRLNWQVMNRLMVMEIPGLTRDMVERHAPALRALSKRGCSAGIVPILPAVTMPAHASVTTGLTPAEHGVVANGWFHREHNEVMFWRQSEGLVRGEPVWEAAKKRDPNFTCLKHFWWPGMASSADRYVNVRPAYFADGRKGSDVYVNAPGMSRELQDKFGVFPLFNFWGPATSIKSTQWIVDTAKYLIDQEQPTLSMVYLPHLDYKQQSHGPNHADIPADIQMLDEVARDLIEFADRRDIQVMAISTYHMNEVHCPVSLNRIFRKQGWLRVIHNATGELIDYGTSEVFAVADHQTAHVYIKNPDMIGDVQAMLLEVAGVARVFNRNDQAEHGVDHPAAGDLFVLAEKKAWFTYYYWLNDEHAPDFARTIAIHAKPGYDPCELFLDPTLTLPKFKIARALLKKKIGMRYLMDVIPLDATLVKGSHGLLPQESGEHPVYINSEMESDLPEVLPMTDLKQRILNQMFE